MMPMKMMMVDDDYGNESEVMEVMLACEVV